MGVVSPERERTAPPGEPPAAPPPPPQPPERRRDVPWTAITVIALILAIFVGVDRIKDWFPSFDNPFASETVDRSRAPVLKAIQDVGEFRGAAGNYEVLVDLEQDTRLPSELLGERTLLVAVGSVDAGVDLTQIDEEAIEVSADGESATITLPGAQLYDAELDLEESYVYSRDRGVLNEIGGLFSDEGEWERQAFIAAEERLEEAARSNDELVGRAETNTRAMIASLVRGLGFERVDVRFS
jgi:hypothetical protein